MPFTWPNGNRAALSLSFDDARLSEIDEGTPLLDKLGVNATFYVLPGGVEKRLSGWKNAVAAGHEIGNHTVSHPCSCNFSWIKANALEDFTLERMQKEFDDADAAIEQLLGVRPKTFAYPCGQQYVGRGENLKSYIPLVAKHFLVGRGYMSEVGADPVKCDLSNVPAFGADRVGFARLKELIEAAAKESRWLCLAAHEIGDHGHQSMTLDVLEELCRYAKDPANGIWVDTIANVGAYVKKQRAG
jgi:hypothetical protein